MAIIILEGCDAVGKDTVGELLSKELGYEMVRGSSFEISELGADGMFEHMMNLLNKNNIIINRFMYSNLVYGSLFDYPMMNVNQFDSLVDEIDEKAIVLYLHAPNGVVSYRMQNRGDDMVKVENIEDIINKYKEEMFGNFRPSTLLSFDTSINSPKRIVDIVKKLT